MSDTTTTTFISTLQTVAKLDSTYNSNDVIDLCCDEKLDKNDESNKNDCSTNININKESDNDTNVEIITVDDNIDSSNNISNDYDSYTSRITKKIRVENVIDATIDSSDNIENDTVHCTISTSSDYHKHKIDNIDELLYDFKINHCHSLRISASNVAAMCGYNPYKNLYELLFDLVYQGRYGQLLMESDANILDLQIQYVDTNTKHEIQLNELAIKSQSNQIQQLVTTAIDIKNGILIPTNVQDIQKLKLIIQNEKQLLNKTLTSNEQKLLLQRINHAIDTGYGTSHETNAIDIYEQQTGCIVTERNSHVYSWPFKLLSTTTTKQLEQSREEEKQEDQQHTTVHISTVAVPILPHAVLRSSMYSTTTSSDSVNQDIDDNKLDKSDENSESKSVILHEKPFFIIQGSVDGIRNELVVVNDDNGLHNNNSLESDLGVEEDNNDHNMYDVWTMKQIIVECKHRMNQLKDSPPLYDQIQCVVYCLMHNTEDADLVEVVRTSSSSSDTNKNDSIESSSKINNNNTIEKYFHRTNNNESIIKNDFKDEINDPINVTIRVHRISINDPIYQHKQCWETIILPRLTSFVQAVYTIRSNDDKRYRLLHAVLNLDTSTGSSDPNIISQAYSILVEECPWLQQCDIAFSPIT